MKTIMIFSEQKNSSLIRFILLKNIYNHWRPNDFFFIIIQETVWNYLKTTELV